jgi:hypothetical protein
MPGKTKCPELLGTFAGLLVAVPLLPVFKSEVPGQRLSRREADFYGPYD